MLAMINFQRSLPGGEAVYLLLPNLHENFACCVLIALVERDVAM